MIRESNTLTWQETAERKKMMRRRERVRRRKRGVANPRTAAVT